MNAGIVSLLEMSKIFSWEFVFDSGLIGVTKTRDLDLLSLDGVDQIPMPGATLIFYTLLQEQPIDNRIVSKMDDI